MPDAPVVVHIPATQVLEQLTPAVERYVREQAAGWQSRALRDYADRHHHFGGGHGPMWAGPVLIDPDAWCACGASWSEDDGGCTERAQLYADAARIEAGQPLETCKHCRAGCRCPRHTDPEAPCGPPPELVQWRIRYPTTGGVLDLGVLDGSEVRAAVTWARAAGLEAVTECRLVTPWQAAAEGDERGGRGLTAPPRYGEPREQPC